VERIAVAQCGRAFRCNGFRIGDDVQSQDRHNRASYHLDVGFNLGISRVVGLIAVRNMGLIYCVRPCRSSRRRIFPEGDFGISVTK
jgi:hypothetical protein